MSVIGQFQKRWQACATALGVDPGDLTNRQYMEWVTGKSREYREKHGMPDNYPLGQGFTAFLGGDE